MFFTPLEEAPKHMHFLPKIEIRSIFNFKDKLYGEISVEEFIESINAAYEEIVLLKKNVFSIPFGKLGKDFVSQLTFWLRQFNVKTHLNPIALKALIDMPILLLAKPSTSSKNKDHVLCLTKRLNDWKLGNIDSLLREARFIQKKMTSKIKEQNQGLSKTFAKLISEGKTCSAIRLLEQEFDNGQIPVDNRILEILKTKHPKAADIDEGVLLNGPLDEITYGCRSL